MDLSAGLDRLGCHNEVVALAPGQHGDLLPVEVLGPSRRSPSTLLALRRSAKAADIVVAHGSATLLACAIALVGCRSPFVYRQISDPLHWAGTWPRRLRTGAFLRRATAIVALASTSADVLCRHYRLRPSRITVLPNAVPGGRFATASAEDRARSRSELGLPENAVVVLYIGALAAEKGVDMLVRVVAASPALHLLIVGDGPERDRLRQLAQRAMPGRAYFTGPTRDPASAFHAADVVALPSRAGDSMPAVLIEAGLCGLPTIATPVGAITDVVLDGRTGSVVPVEDEGALAHALGHIVSHPAVRASMGAAARAHCVERFTIEATAPRWLELLLAHRR